MIRYFLPSKLTIKTSLSPDQRDVEKFNLSVSFRRVNDVVVVVVVVVVVSDPAEWRNYSVHLRRKVNPQIQG